MSDEPREVAVLQSRLLRREEELAAAQRENRTLRASQRILEAELRRDDVDSATARRELEGARRSESEWRVVTSSLNASLRHEEGVRQALVADHRGHLAAAHAEAAAIRSEVAHEESMRVALLAAAQAEAEGMREALVAAAAAEAAVQRAEVIAIRSEVRHEEGVRQALVARHHAQAHAIRSEAAVMAAEMAAEIGEVERATRVQEDRTRQLALAADAERALVAAELGATERSLAVASARAERAAAAATNHPAGRGQRGAADGPPADATSQTVPRPRNDGLTQAELATGPSGPATEPPWGTLQPPADGE